MALEVPVRETPGDCGLRGKGGGALSGSELSHLFLISERRRTDMTWSWRVARVERKGKHTWEPGHGCGPMMRNADVSMPCLEGHPAQWAAL
jgi:hypothetical protein